jgi:hypothetical protein
LNAGNET